MIILDAIIAGILMHYFSTDWLPVLGMTCMITFLRMSLKIDGWLNALGQGINAFVESSEFEKENEKEME